MARTFNNLTNGDFKAGMYAITDYGTMVYMISNKPSVKDPKCIDIQFRRSNSHLNWNNIENIGDLDPAGLFGSRMCIIPDTDPEPVSNPCPDAKNRRWRTDDNLPGHCYEYDNGRVQIYIISKIFDMDRYKVEWWISEYGGPWYKKSFNTWYIGQTMTYDWREITPDKFKVKPPFQIGEGAPTTDKSLKVAIPENAYSPTCKKCGGKNKQILAFANPLYWCQNCEP
jgi:hypothetical protein